MATNREIIFRAVREACNKHIEDHGRCIRSEVARDAALIANRRGVNTSDTTADQNTFIEALDKKEKEGFFCD